MEEGKSQEIIARLLKRDSIGALTNVRLFHPRGRREITGVGLRIIFQNNVKYSEKRIAAETRR